MLKDTYPYYLANQPVMPNTDLEVTDKYSGDIATRVAMADGQAIDKAIARAVVAAAPMRAMAAYERQQVLSHCVRRFTERTEELAQAQSKIAARVVLASERPRNRLFNVGGNWQHGREYRSVRDDIDAIRAVSVNDVAEVLGEILDLDHRAAAFRRRVLGSVARSRYSSA